MHQSVARLSVFIIATVVASSSAVELPNNNQGLRNFLYQKEELKNNMVKVGEGATCNPSGSNPDDPEEQDCEAGQYCSLQGLSEGECPDPDVEQHGVCMTISYRCNRMSRPVCGCDGVTYPNHSCTKGVNIAHSGSC